MFYYLQQVLVVLSASLMQMKCWKIISSLIDQDGQHMCLLQNLSLAWGVFTLRFKIAEKKY